jgi:hypothetical protein
MAIHPDLKSLLHESVREYLEVAEYCLAYRKDANWGAAEVGGCLGYPAAVMLFSVVDTIGSFHRGSAAISVVVDGRPVKIRKEGFQHFFILNSDYYDLHLSELTIRRLYENFRNLLMHNASLAPNHALSYAPDGSEPFPVVNGKQRVNLAPFLIATRMAVSKFLTRLDSVVPGSDQARNIGLKR